MSDVQFNVAHERFRDGMVRVTYSAVIEGVVVYTNILICYYDHLTNDHIYKACVARMRKILRITSKS